MLQTYEEEAFDDILTASCNHFNQGSNNEDDSQDEMQQLQLNKHLLLQQGLQPVLNIKAQSKDADA